VRVYSIVLVAGTVLCLAAMAAFTVPTDLTLISHAVTRIGPSRSPMTNLDSSIVLLILASLHTVWAVTWWRRHRARIALWAKNRWNSRRAAAGHRGTPE